MEVESAVRLLNEVVYKPGWSITAEDFSKRFEDAVAVHFEYPARQSERPDSFDGYPNAIMARASFVVMASECGEDCDLYRKLLRLITRIEEHEAREFLRVKPTNWAPFHPHRADGMKRWGDEYGDLTFGAM